jgi:hypothetical protein
MLLIYPFFYPLMINGHINTLINEIRHDLTLIFYDVFSFKGPEETTSFLGS